MFLAYYRRPAVCGVKKVFLDKNTAVVAVDRLVHHCVMLEMNMESCRHRHALKQKKKQGEPAKSVTENDLTSWSLPLSVLFSLLRLGILVLIVLLWGTGDIQHGSVESVHKRGV